MTPTILGRAVHLYLGCREPADRHPYPGQPGKQTAFAYDGLGRRITISSTPAGGGGATVSNYLWCGSALCEARNSANATTREYLGEGEYTPGCEFRGEFRGHNTYLAWDVWPR